MILWSSLASSAESHAWAQKHCCPLTKFDPADAIAQCPICQWHRLILSPWYVVIPQRDFLDAWWQLDYIMETAEICSHWNRHLYLHMNLSSLLIILCQPHPHKLTKCLISARYSPQHFFWGRNYFHSKRLQPWAHTHRIIYLTTYPIIQKWLTWLNLEWLIDSMGFPGGPVVKNPPANIEDARNTGLSPGSVRSPGVGNGNPLSILAWKIPGTESLMDYSSWGHKGDYMTEHTHTLIL